MSASNLESKFAIYWRALEGQPLRQEHQFQHGRRWRFDFAHPQTRTAIEIEGGQWSGGRHTRGSGFGKDCEKYNAAALEGWTVFRLTGSMIRSDNLVPIINHIFQRSAKQ